MTDNVIQLRTVPTADDFALFAFREALFAILNDARDLEHARQLAGEALVVAGGGDAA